MNKKIVIDTKSLIVVISAAIVAILIGLSYSWLRLTKSSNTVNKITAGDLELVLDDTTSEGIKLVNEVPRSYRQGMETKEYTFTLTNKNSTSNYSLSLKDLEKYTDEDGKETVIADENRINDSKIRYILLKDGEESSADKSKILTDRTIDTGTIKKGQTISYTLRVWIDSRAETDIMGKIFNAQLSLVAEQTSVKLPVSFENDSWNVISKAVKENNYPYQVGDTKTVDMGSLGTHTVRVANTSACTNGETSETACGFVLEFTDILNLNKMNSDNLNTGGWMNSEVRNYINTTLFSSLPTQLQDIIEITTVVSGHGNTKDESDFTTKDKLYLLSAKEVYNISDYDTASNTTRQLDYYKQQGVTLDNYKKAIKVYAKDNYSWWLRPAYSNDWGNHSYLIVYQEGNWSARDADNNLGVSPAFRIV